MPIGAIASLAGGIISGIGSSSAADTTAKANLKAADLAKSEFDQTKKDLSPYAKTGESALSLLTQNYLGITPSGGFDSANAPLLQDPRTKLGPSPTYNMPQFTAGLYQQSPGYNFELQGGVDALTNAGATRSGALSGNTLKAIQGYGTGLASQDYYKAYDRYAQDYYNQFTGNSSNYWKNYDASNQYDKNIYNWLYGLSSLGENAAATTGSLGQTAASTAGSDLIGAGTATAAGTLGTTSAVTGTLNKLTDSSTTTGGLNSYLSSLLYGSSGGTDYGNQFPAGGTSY